MPFQADGDSVESAVYDAPSTFDPYDPSDTPEAVQPTSPGPAQSSSAPGIGDTSGTDGERDTQAPQGNQEQQDPEEDPLPEFDPRYRDELVGLLFLGRLKETFTYCGHQIAIRTLTTEDLAKIGLLIKSYDGTTAFNAVYQAAFVAASLVTVDGKPLPVASLTLDDADALDLRFQYVLRQYMPPVREHFYNKAFALEVTSRNVLAAMGKASG